MSSEKGTPEKGIPELGPPAGQGRSQSKGRLGHVLQRGWQGEWGVFGRVAIEKMEASGWARLGQASLTRLRSLGIEWLHRDTF